MASVVLPILLVTTPTLWVAYGIIKTVIDASVPLIRGAMSAGPTGGPSAGPTGGPPVGPTDDADISFVPPSGSAFDADVPADSLIETSFGRLNGASPRRPDALFLIFTLPSKALLQTTMYLSKGVVIFDCLPQGEQVPDVAIFDGRLSVIEPAEPLTLADVRTLISNAISAGKIIGDRCNDNFVDNIFEVLRSAQAVKTMVAIRLKRNALNSDGPNLPSGARGAPGPPDAPDMSIALEALDGVRNALIAPNAGDSKTLNTSALNQLVPSTSLFARPVTPMSTPPVGPRCSPEAERMAAALGRVDEGFPRALAQAARAEPAQAARTSPALSAEAERAAIRDDWTGI
jgi:hypothetical protein